MKSKTIYTCEYCSYEDANPIQVESHEATHIGNGLSLNEYQEYKKLQDNIARTSAQILTRNNDTTRQNRDNAINKLIAFEEKHGIIS